MPAYPEISPEYVPRSAEFQPTSVTQTDACQPTPREPSKFIRKSPRSPEDSNPSIMISKTIPSGQCKDRVDAMMPPQKEVSMIHGKRPDPLFTPSKRSLSKTVKCSASDLRGDAIMSPSMVPTSAGATASAPAISIRQGRAGEVTLHTENVTLSRWGVTSKWGLFE